MPDQHDAGHGIEQGELSRYSIVCGTLANGSSRLNQPFGAVFTDVGFVSNAAVSISPVANYDHGCFKLNQFRRWPSGKEHEPYHVTENVLYADVEQCCQA